MCLCVNVCVWRRLAPLRFRQMRIKFLRLCSHKHTHTHTHTQSHTHTQTDTRRKSHARTPTTDLLLTHVSTQHFEKCSLISPWVVWGGKNIGPVFNNT